jgi:acyl carrier protein
MSSEEKSLLKNHIINYLNLEDVKQEEIQDEAPLFGDGLGLDSIDALELIVMIEREYNVKISDPSMGKEILYSVDTMANYIDTNK